MRLDDSGIWQRDHSSLKHSVNLGQWSLATFLTGARWEEARVWRQGGAQCVAHRARGGTAETLLQHKWEAPCTG